MTIQTFEYCSLCYLNLWSETDKLCHEILSNDVSREQKLVAIKTVASVYSVARNLQKKYDLEKGLERFAPVLDILDLVDIDNLKKYPINEIDRTKDMISEKYGSKGVLSLTTKLLWFKVRSPVLIYDSQAQKALGTKSSDLEGFYTEWLSEFNRYEEEINEACSQLEKMYRYMIISNTKISKDEVKQISTERWFRERVFDMYLWKKG